MEIDYKAAGFWWQVLITVINILGWVYVLMTSKQKDNASAIEEFKKELSEIDTRLTGVEKDIEHLPTHEDMAKLHERVNEANENIKHISGQLTQIDYTMKLVNKYLLESGK